MAVADLAVQVRQLSVADLAAYRALHRFGLSEAPQAFVETLANDAARPDATVLDMLERREGWGVFIGERLVGKLVIDTLPYDCLAHTRWLHAVYLHPGRPGVRGGRRNAAARRMYERLGFVETGRVPGGIEVGGTYVDDVLMTLTLTQ